MALTQTTRDYEILVRFNDNGKVGAHRQSLTEIKDGDQLLSAVINPPEQLTLEELQAAVSALTPEDWFEPVAPGVAE